MVVAHCKTLERFSYRMASMNKVTFTPGLPEVLALKWTKGKEQLSQYHNETEYFYSLTDGRCMYLPAEAAAQLDDLGPAKDEPIEVTKFKSPHGGYRWRVARVGEVAAANTKPVAGRAEGGAPSAQPARRVLPNASAAAEVSTAPKLSGSPMMTALKLAIDAAYEAEAYAQRLGMGLSFSTEDVRAMGISLFIEATKYGGAR